MVFSMDLQRDLQSVWDEYLAAYRNGDAAGCAAVFCRDALLTSPYGPPARGRAQIEALHSQWVGEGGENKQLEMVDFGGGGTLAWCLAKFSEGLQTGAGMSLSVLERHDGRWLIKMCSLNE